MPRKEKTEKKVTRYTYEDVKEPRTPETGHTSLLPAEEQVVTLPMDNGWSKAVVVGKLPEGDERPVVVDMDPAADPVLFWAGKRNRRDVPVLPLQRNEIVSESRIAQIIERARRAAQEKSGATRQGHLFADLEKTLRETDRSKRVEFYTHEEGWKNKLICGDSLHVMESLLHYENMRGKVQMIYIDPPYGIKYDSNFQQRVDIAKNDEKDVADDVLTIKAFRDTWTLGIHSYLSYLVERLYLCRELLSSSGSIFVQISPENVHLVRVVCDEVFGSGNRVAQIAFQKSGASAASVLEETYDYLLWFARDREHLKAFQVLLPKVDRKNFDRDYCWIESPAGDHTRRLTDAELKSPGTIPEGWRRFRLAPCNSQDYSSTRTVPYKWNGKTFHPGANRHWSVDVPDGLDRVASKHRLWAAGNSLMYKLYVEESSGDPLESIWADTAMAGLSDTKWYVVQTNEKVVGRCILMATEPGDLVFDPTCGSGTTGFAAERWGRRWVSCDTSRVAINVARSRILSSVFDHFVMKGAAPSGGFRYKTAQKVTLSTIAYDKEAEKADLVDQPEIDGDAIRVQGPFELMSLGRYSVEDWRGYVVREPGVGEAAKLENYIEVICRLYRKDVAIQGATGLVHAVAEAEKEKIAISVGPLSGRVTGKQINDAVQDALASGILEVHVLGWAFEANVGEVKSQLEKRGKVKVELIMIRPDTLAEGLKATQPEMLFSPLALPDIEVAAAKNGKEKQLRVTLKGVALFDRKRRTTEYKAADSGYVSAWYLDEDYDGDCFVDCQMFFDFKKTPNIKAALRTEVDPEEFTLKLDSEPFPVRGYKRIAVKVVDVYGNESVVVRDLA
jgi:adenine-specific DNA-methyltransferase